jgi:hypothetical protein
MKKKVELTFVREGRCSVAEYPNTPLQIARCIGEEELQNYLGWDIDYEGEPGASKLRKMRITATIKVECLDI